LPGIDPAVAPRELLERLSIKLGATTIEPYIVNSPRRTFRVRSVASEGKARYGAAAVVELDPRNHPPYRLLEWQSSLRSSRMPAEPLDVGEC
jgi:hypothetical protein